MNIYDIWFSRVEIVNNIKLKLLQKFTSEQLWSLSKTEFQELKLKENTISKIFDIKYRKHLEKYEIYMKKNKIYLVSFKDKLYPEKLKYILDKPAYIFIKGNIDILDNDSVAIIGARNCTEYGKKVAFNTAKELSDMNINIVSGMAIGIDTFAHIGALKGKHGKTIAVLGNGLHVSDIYPEQNINLFEKIVENGGSVLSEYIVGTKATKYNFPQRNRIVSGISNKLLVVEASEKSGTLITVRICIRARKRCFFSSR